MRSPDSRPAAPIEEAGRRAGLVVRAPDGAPFFVAAREVKSVVTPQSALALGRAGGANIGLALVDGRLAVSLDLSSNGAGAAPPSGPALLACPEGRADSVLVVGLEIVATGTFASGLEARTILHRCRTLPVVDLGDRIREIEAAAFRTLGPPGLGARGGSEP